MKHDATRLAAPVSNALVVLAVALGVWGVSQARTGGAAPVAALPAEGLTYDLGTIEAGTSVPVVISVPNRGDTPVRIVGMNELCTRAGCIRAVNLPVEIPAGASRALRFEFASPRPTASGNVLIETAVFTDCPETPQLTVKVTGKTAPAAVKPAGAAKNAG